MLTIFVMNVDMEQPKSFACEAVKKMDICAYCGEDMAEDIHQHCRDCKLMAVKNEQQLSLEGEWQ